jgi:hypothetical protein
LAFSISICIGNLSLAIHHRDGLPLPKTPVI